MNPQDYQPRLPRRVPASSTARRDDDGPDIRDLPEQNSPEEWEGLSERAKEARENAAQAVRDIKRRWAEREDEGQQQRDDNSAERNDYYRRKANEAGLHAQD
jgi:hypothetical protein